MLLLPLTRHNSISFYYFIVVALSLVYSSLLFIHSSCTNSILNHSRCLSSQLINHHYFSLATHFLSSITCMFKLSIILSKFEVTLLLVFPFFYISYFFERGGEGGGGGGGCVLKFPDS